MNASHVMCRDVYTVEPSTSLTRSHQLMKSLGVRHLPVVLDGKLCGIVSDRDLLRVGEEDIHGNIRFTNETVAAVMTTRPYTASGKTSVSEMAALMMEHGISSLPIVDSRNTLEGLVTTTDMLELLREDPRARREALPYDFRVHVIDDAIAVGIA